MLRDHAYGVSASRGVTAYASAIAGTCCAYLARLSQRGWLDAYQMVFPSEDGHPT